MLESKLISEKWKERGVFFCFQRLGRGIRESVSGSGEELFPGQLAIFSIIFGGKENMDMTV